MPLCGDAGRNSPQSDTDRNALEKTSEGIRAAFAGGDIATIMAYHHPEVVKSLSYANYLIGREAVQKDIAATLQRFHLEWKENQVRSILIQGDTAVELTDFVIQGTPKNQVSRFSSEGGPWLSTSVIRIALRAGHPSARSSNLQCN
jgi:ketosteroid isomerase-like protein